MHTTSYGYVKRGVPEVASMGWGSRRLRRLHGDRFHVGRRRGRVGDRRRRRRLARGGRARVVLAEDIEVTRDARLVRALLHDMLTQLGFECRLLLDDFAQLLLRQLQERAEALRGDEFRTPDEALPQRRVRPDFLRDQAREERRRHETAQRAVRGHGLDDLW